MASRETRDETPDAHTKLAEAWKRFIKQVEDVNQTTDALIKTHRSQQSSQR